MFHKLKMMLALACSLALLSCQKNGSFAGFVSGSFGGLKTIVVNADGSVTLGWDAATNTTSATYSVYQIDLGVSDEKAGSTSLVNIEKPMSLAESSNLLASVAGSPYTVKDGILATHKYAYLVRVNSDDIVDSNQVMQTVVAAKTMTGSSGTPTDSGSTITKEDLKALQAIIAEINAKNLAKKQIKIIAAGSGDATEIGTLGLLYGGNVTLRAALYDMSNNYIADVPVLWSMTNSVFASSTMSVASGTGSATMTFTPTAIGTTVFQATYVGTDTDVTKISDVTGAVSVTTTQVPTSVVMYSGNSQAVTVGATLPQSLTILLKDALGLPLSGTSMTFYVVSGGGAIVGAAVQTTDSNGFASASVSVGTTAGQNEFKAYVTSNPSVTMTSSFIATGLAGPVTQMVFTTQPACTDYTKVFSVTPVLVLRDVYNNITSSSGTVDIATNPSVGTGTFTAGNSGTVVNGTVSFPNLKYSKAETSVQFVASLSGTAITATSGAFRAYVGNQKIKILSGLSGNTSAITAQNVTAFASLSMHAALFDANDVYVADEPLTKWSWTAGTFATSDVNVAAGTNSLALTLTPTSLNTASFTVDYAGSDPTVTVTRFNSAAITSVANTASTLTFTTQPVCSDYTVACSTQPSIIIKDAGAHTALISGTVTISASPVTGTGTFGGSLSATVTNGVATFSGLTYSKFESVALTGVQAKLTATLDGTPAVTANSASFDVGTGNKKVKILSGSSGNTAALTATLSITGTTTNGSTSLTSVSSIAGVVAGMGISGSNIPAYAVVSSASGSTIVMSAAATATASGTSVTLNRTNAIVASPYSMHAVFVDANDNYVSDADSSVLWTWTGSTFAGADVSPATGVRSMAMTLTPSSIATATFTATYDGTDTAVTTKTFTSASITSVSSGVANSMAISSGNSQSGTAGSNLASSLQVVVKDSNLVVLSGITVDFTVLSGGGSITASAVTNASGIATATATLGTVSGVSNSFKAAVNGNTGINATFTASSVPGAVTQLVWTSTPATCFVTAPCGTQPSITAKDSNGNVVTAATSTLTLSASGGCLAVTGVASAAMNSGILTFSTVGCTTTGSATVANAVLTATYGSVTANSSAFTVSAAPPGACLTNDSYFTTSSGGCTDLGTSGLTWSMGSAGTYTWTDAVWDKYATGNANTAETDPYGRTNDYDPAYNSATQMTLVDSSGGDYCHALNEGGQTDWRLPMVSELATLTTHLNARTGTTYLGVYGTTITTTGTTTASNATVTVASATGLSVGMQMAGTGITAAIGTTPPMISAISGLTLTVSTPGSIASSQTGIPLYFNWPLLTSGRYNGTTAITFLMQASTQTYQGNTATHIHCVRGGRTAADRLAVTANPMKLATGSNNVLTLWPITVQIQDSVPNNSNTQGVVVTVATNLGTIGGTTTATTDQFGVATFSSFTLDTAGSATLTFTATGYTSATKTLTVGTVPHTCAIDDGVKWTTTDGGCKQIGTNKIWSLPSILPMSWMEAIWSSALASNAAADVNDGARTNDYDLSAGALTVSATNTDQSLTNYCHALVEGGYSDWRVPTCAELNNVNNYADGAKGYNQTTQSLSNFNYQVNAAGTTTWNNAFWSAGSGTAGGACATSVSSLNAYNFNLKTGTQSNAIKTTGSAGYVICVRP
jgi:fibronectin-binding autotransporter adhesin